MQTSGKHLVRETSVRESDCPGNVRYPTRLRSYPTNYKEINCFITKYHAIK